MSSQLALVLALLVAAIVMFAINKPRMDVVALIMLTALPLTGVISMKDALAGFSDANIVLIAALFVIGEGLVRTGVAQRLGDWLIAKAGRSEIRLISLLMVVVCGLGATMSSTAVTAIFIPVALRISQSTHIGSGRLMMPLSAAALISGMTTLIATAPNLVVNSELVYFLQRSGKEAATGFHFFSFTPFGIPILALGIGYMLFARRWLPATSVSNAKDSGHVRLADWVEEYKLAAREHRVSVPSGSSLAGKTLEEVRLRDTSGANLVAIERDRTLVQPTAKTKFVTGDILLVDFFAPGADVESLARQYALEMMPLSGAYFTDRSQEIGMVEVIVPADSDLVGKTVAETRFRDHFGLTVIGVRRRGVARGLGLQNETVELGDTLLLIGPWKAIKNLRSGSRDLVILNLPIEIEEVLPAPGKAIQAVGCLLLVVGLMISGVVPNVQAALIGCLLMGALGCVDLKSAYNSINWKTLVLIVGMLPFSRALQNTGGVEMAANGLMSVIGGAGPYAVLACLFAITAALGMFISNTATAVLMAPVALALAKDLDKSPYSFAMIVALASSTAFMTPVSSPVNTLVVGPGNYKFGDFVRIGVPFSLIVLVVSIIMVPWLLPL